MSADTIHAYALLDELHKVQRERDKLRDEARNLRIENNALRITEQARERTHAIIVRQMQPQEEPTP